MSPRVLRLLGALLLLSSSACGAGQPQPGRAAPAGTRGALAGRYLWLQTRCVDGPVAVAELGFSQELVVTPRAGAVQLAFDTRMADRDCSALSLWDARVPPPGPRGEALPDLTLAPRARIELPVDARCGPAQRAPSPGSLRRAGDVLHVTVRRSEWCRGLQAELTYRVAGPAPPHTDEDAIRHFLAHFGAGDADGAAALFSRGGVLVEPFATAAGDVGARHQGRAAVLRWLHAALADREWVALRLRALDALSEPGRYAATYEYMDPDLEAPLLARNLFVVADGEIFETEFQLVDSPRRRERPVAAATADAGVPDAGSGGAGVSDAGSALAR